jgi:hypothetical protein
LKSENSLQVRPVGIPNGGMLAIPILVIALLIFLLFHRMPAIGIGAAFGILIGNGVVLFLLWNPKVNHWWSFDPDGISYWIKPSDQHEAHRKSWIAWNKISQIKINAVSPWLDRGVSIKATDGTKLWIPRQTDRYFELIEFLGKETLPIKNDARQ